MYNKNENKTENDLLDYPTRLGWLNFLFCWTPWPMKQHPLFCTEKYQFYKNKTSTVWRNFLHEGIWLDENIQSPYVTVEQSLNDCHHSHIHRTTSKPLLLSYVRSDMIGWITSSYVVILFSFLLYGKGNFIPSSTKTKNYFCFVFVFVIHKGWP